MSALPRASVSTGPTAPAFVLGLGLGGFIDGIVLHQILQWHHLLTDTGDPPSDTVSGLDANTLAPLSIHHVRDDLGGPLAWDLAFLGSGVLLVVGGLALARPGRVRSRPGAYLR